MKNRCFFYNATAKHTLSVAKTVGRLEMQRMEKVPANLSNPLSASKRVASLRTPQISVVIPVYNESEVLPQLFDRLIPILHSLGDYEVVFVNDGGRDGSAEIIGEQLQSNDRIILVNLTRNFGHQPALTAGLEHASGQAVIMMDADLQDPPEVIPEMINAWKEGAEIVIAKRKSRREGLIRRMLFWLFYRILSLLSDYPIAIDAGIFSLIDRRPLDHFLRLKESCRFIPGLRSWLGYRQKIIFYDRDRRQAGKPKQTILRLVSYALDAIFSFSYKPLRIASITGLLLSALGFMYGFVLFILRIFEINLVRGYTSLILVVLILGGFQLISVGLVGEYVGRIYDEVKRRPLFIIDSVLRNEDSKVL